MPGGERVGEAYVRIHASGEGLNREIRDLFDDQNAAYDESGRRNSKAYNDAFQREMKSAPNQTKLRKSLTDSLAKGDFLEQDFFQGRNWKNFRAGLVNEFGEAGRLAGDNLENEMLQGMTFEGLEGRLDNITRDVVRAQKQLNTETARMDQERLQRHRDMLAAYAEDERRTQRLGVMQEQAALIDRKRTIDSLKSQYTDLTALIDRMNRGEEETRHDRGALMTQLRSLRDGMEKYGLVTHTVNDELGDSERHLRNMQPQLARFRGNVNRLSDSVGKAFGKGSRNDFVNFIGSLAGGLVRVGNIIPGIIGSVSNLARTFRFEGAGAGFSQLGGAILRLGTAIGALFVLIGPLLSIFSLLGGVVVALASSIGFALVGAVGALAGGLLGLVAGFGVLALAVSSVDWKTLEDDMRPVSEAFDRLQQASIRGVFGGNEVETFGGQMSRLSKIMDQFVPLVEKVGTSVSTVFTGWIDMMNTGGRNGPFTTFVDALETFLPNAVTQLGSIVGETFGGIGGLLRGTFPIAQEMFDWLSDIASEFNDWANSVSGQRSIQQFFEDASSSVKAFGGFLGSVTDLLLTFLNSGRSAGDSMFTSMSEAIDGWVRKLQDNPDILSDWFDSAEKFGQAIGDIVVGLGEIFAALDSGPSRTAVVAIFDTLGASLKVLGEVLEAVGPEMAGFLVVLGGGMKIMGSLGRTAAGVTALSGALRGFGPAAAGAAASGGAASTALAGLGPAIAVAVGGGMLANYAMHMGQADLSNRQFTKGLNELASSGHTATFDHMARGVTTLGDALHGAVFMDFGAPFMDQIRKMDTALSEMDPTKARQAFQAIVEQGRAAGLTLADVTKLFPKYRAAQTEAFTDTSNKLIEQSKNWFLLGNEMRSLPPEVRSRITTPGLIKSLDDVDSLRIMYDLTPKQVVTTLAASGAAETISQVRTARREFNLTPKQVTTLLRLNGQVETAAAVRRYAKALGLTPKQVSTLLKATDGYSKTVHEGERAMTRFDRLKPTPVLKADNKDALAKTAAASRRLADVHRQKTIPKIGTDASQALSQAANVKGRLQDIGGMRPRPSIGVNDNASGTIGAIQSRINSLEGKTIVIRTQHIEERIQRMGGPVTASGGMFNRASLRWIGEAGPEAVVPLARPLSQVDPAVRWLSALAQGKVVPGMASGGTVGTGKQVDASGWTIVTPGTDPAAVAAQVVNRLAVTGY